MCNDLTKIDLKVIDDVLIEHFKDKNIVSKCPRCGGNMIVNEIGNSCIVKCVNGCIEDGLRGIWFCVISAISKRRVGINISDWSFVIIMLGWFLWKWKKYII